MLLVTNNFPPVCGGSAVVYDNIARVAAGTVDVLAAQIDYRDGAPLIAWREHDRQAPYRIHRLPLLRTILPARLPFGWRQVGFVIRDLAIRFRVLATILWLARRERYGAVCLGELLASGWMIYPLRRLLGLRVIVYVHGEEITTHDLYDPVKRRCRRLLRKVDGIVVVSRFAQTAVLDLVGPQAASKILLIQNGVASTTFTPGPKRRDLLAHHHLENTFVFVSVCRLLEKKGIDNALRAFATIGGGRPGDPRDSCFLVIGSGAYQTALVTLADELGIADRVVFTGQVPDDDLVDLYRLGDVFVMPNRRLPDGDTEGFGLVFLEANGCGLPVIAGCDGGSTDAVQHQVNGLVVDGHSVPDIAIAMSLLRHDAALREQLSRRGLEMARDASWTLKAEAFLHFCLTPPGREPPAASSASRGWRAVDVSMWIEM